MRKGNVLINGKEVELYNFDWQPSQLFRELRTVQALNPFPGNVAGARGQMFASHITQRLPIFGATLKRIVTGEEWEYAKCAFQDKFEKDATIIQIIHYYRPSYGSSEIGLNPETLIIFENRDNEIDAMSITEYKSYHSYFGYEPRKTKLYKSLHKGMEVDAGDVVTIAPSVHQNGSLMYGIQAEVIMASMPGVSEDGVMMSLSCAKRLGFYTYEKRVVEWGGKRFPKNIYGTPYEYKPHPSIGERIHPSGVLMRFAKYDQDFSVVNMSRRQAMEPDEVFDQAVYVDGPGGVVVDIRVMHDPNQVSTTPELMAMQTNIYDQARRQYYEEIVKYYNQLLAQRGENLKISPRFSVICEEAISIVRETQNTRQSNGEKTVHPQKLYRGSPMDDYRVEFTIRYEITPTVGFKVTGIQGDKGVLVNIVPDEDMPMNANGVRAEIVMDPNSTISRMNASRKYEQAINAAARDMVIDFGKQLGTNKYHQKLTLQEKMNIENAWRANDPKIKALFERLVGFYDTTDQGQAALRRSLNSEQQLKHFIHVLENGVYLQITGEQELEPVDMLRGIKRNYMPMKSPVRYRSLNGEFVYTRNSFIIGEMYIMLLEKTGDDWTAVSSSKFQNFGVIAKLTNKDKYSQPTRNQAIRGGGEAEIRIILSYCGPFFAAEFLDRNSSIVSHRVACETVLSAPVPTNIPVIIDRKKVPLGKARPMQLVKHIGYCCGWKLTYRPYVDPEPMPGYDTPEMMYKYEI